MDHFTWAVNNIDKISPKKCRKWAEKYLLEHVYKMYEEYFDMLHKYFFAGGFYQENPDRKNLDCINCGFDITVE